MNDIIVKRIFAFLIDGVIVTLPFQIIAFQIWDYLLKNYADELIYIIMAYQFLPYLIYFFISEMCITLVTIQTIIPFSPRLSGNRRIFVFKTNIGTFNVSSRMFYVEKSVCPLLNITIIFYSM